MRTKARGHVFYGWSIVAVSFLCWFSADAFGWYTFGIFLGPISSELGWTTVALTGALTLRTVVGGLMGPLIGPLVDTRHGARVLMSLGVLIALWLLLIGFNITGLALSGVFIHFYPYLESKGIEPGVAATAVTTFAFCAAMVKIP